MRNIEIESELVQPDSFTEESLEALKYQLSVNHYPGYPEKRLVMLAWYLRSTPDGGLLKLPDGPWEMNSTDLPSETDQEQFKQQGLVLDTKGRPVHPWISHMLFDRNIGVITGKGFYWKWGPNYTADPIVTRDTDQGKEILLIQRGDTGRWALPGGFVDPDENPFDTALRETCEETGLDISNAAQTGRAIYDGPLADLRVTANAWPHTYAFHFDVTGLDLQAPKGQDDAVDATWILLDELPNVLFGSHALLIKKALE